MPEESINIVTRIDIEPEGPLIKATMYVGIDGKVDETSPFPLGSISRVACALAPHIKQEFEELCKKAATGVIEGFAGVIEGFAKSKGFDRDPAKPPAEWHEQKELNG